MAEKERREPAKGLDYIEVHSCLTEAGAESFFCIHTRELRPIASDIS